MSDASNSRKLFVALMMVVIGAALTSGCGGQHSPSTHQRENGELGASATEPQSLDSSEYAQARAEMVATQLVARDIVDPRVIDAMRRVPRHLFVPPSVRDHAYGDGPLPIGHGQTISQPYIVALMTQLVDAAPSKKALDVGTGSGYQAAVLAELVQRVYSIEIVEPLAVEARQRLQQLGYENITVRHGDGYLGWPSEAPFDVIVVAAAPDHLPPALVEQLARGGKMVIPVGAGFQELMLIEKDAAGEISQRTIAPVSFVPMTGAAERQ